jgi:hypothetical protein
VPQISTSLPSSIFALTFSGWKSADVVLGSESFVALADGCETLMGELSIKRDI